MDFMTRGKILLRFSEGKIMSAFVGKNSSRFSLKVLFGSQQFETSEAAMSGNKLQWNDTMEYVVENEEVIKFECYCNGVKNSCAILPIQTVISKEYYKGTIMLMNSGKIFMHLGVEFAFSSKQEIPTVSQQYIYTYPPPEVPHNHAVENLRSTVYTPYNYFKTFRSEGDYLN